MAPLMTVQMEKIQQRDLETTYWMMFKHMIKDFVHTQDLKNILNSASVNGGSVATSTGPQPVVRAQIVSAITDGVARSKLLEYKTNIETGNTEKAIDLAKTKAIVGAE